MVMTDKAHSVLLVSIFFFFKYQFFLLAVGLDSPSAG